jgi:hypothetical protein
VRAISPGTDWWSIVVPSLGVLVAAFLTAWLGYRYWRKQWEHDRAVRRQSIATVFLVEIRWIERALRRIAARKGAGLSTIVVVPATYDRFERDLVLFSPAVIAQLITFRGLVRDLELGGKVFEQMLDPGRRDRYDHFVRTKAAFIANMIPRLRRDLEDAGGIVVEEDPPQVVKFPDVVSLVPPAFPEEQGSALSDFTAS